MASKAGGSHEWIWDMVRRSRSGWKDEAEKAPGVRVGGGGAQAATWFYVAAYLAKAPEAQPRQTFTAPPGGVYVGHDGTSCVAIPSKFWCNPQDDIALSR